MNQVNRLAAIAAIALLGAAPDAAAQTEIGVSEWVSPTAWGSPPGADRREIGRHEAIVEDELIETDPRGAADFVLENGSRVLVGPDCDVVLDDIFYHPELDQVASMDVYADTICVVRAGAGGETLSFETPVAIVTISEASATVVYFGAQANSGSGATLHLAASGPGALPRGVDLAVFFESGLEPGGGSFVAVRTDTGEVAVLRRPGFMVLHATPGGLGEPQPTDPGLLGRAVARLTGTGRPTGLPADLATAPSVVEIHSALERPPRLVFPLEACAISNICDAVGIETTDDDFTSPLQ